MRKKTSGFSLLEVLVTVLIVSFGMLGVAAALMTVHRSTSSSYLQQQSAQLGADIIERMRQNVPAVQSGTYDVTYTGGAVSAPALLCDPNGAACSSTQQASYDLWQWLSAANSTLPGANTAVAVTLTGNNNYDVKVIVSYDDTPASQTLNSSPARRSIELETLL